MSISRPAGDYPCHQSQGDARMKYACLVYVDDSAMAALSDDQRKTLTDDSIGFDWDVRNSGHLVMAQPLDAPKTAVTIRSRNGKLSRTDGPFAETKEFLGGFFLVEADGIDEAVKIAAKSPMTRMGSIEVRPFLEQTHSVTGQRRPPPQGS
jgi:hypothetical protein